MSKAKLPGVKIGKMTAVGDRADGSLEFLSYVRCSSFIELIRAFTGNEFCSGKMHIVAVSVTI